MHYVTDLHLHSKYSRAVSPRMNLPVMAQFARVKGLDILSASDWTHPTWFKEIRGLLEEGEGLYRLRSEISNSKSQINTNKQKEVLFLLSTEISSIYKQGDKLRRIHNLIFVPSFETAEKVNNELLKRGCNLSADGRPIIGLTSRNLLELILSIDERVLLIPCHVWTPHFGVYGSKSGFDSLDEAFGDLAKYIYGIETGISSDPEMNWRIPELKNRSILSFSDAHSPANMAREATVFMTKNGISNSKSQISNTENKISYEDIRQAIMRKKDSKLKIGYTIEFYPEEGKYHFSGHRNCKAFISPEELGEKGMNCPVCGKEFTEGVAPRIEQLAGAEFASEYKETVSGSGVKWYTDKTKNHPPYVKLIRLQQIIAAGLGVTVASQKVDEMYSKICPVIGTELDILLKTPTEQIEKIAHSVSSGQAGSRIAQTLERVRSGKVEIDPGYDGLYGKVKIWNETEQEPLQKDAPQLSLDI